MALRQWAFERRLGVTTSAVVRLEELGVAGPEREFYAPAGWLTLQRILPRWEVRPRDVFLDLGSGMGRVVIIAASRYRFRLVIGLEISADLTEVALENLRATRARLRSDVELVTGDVLDYEIPDEVTVAFLNNPFRGETFRTVLDRLAARRRRVIYRAPREQRMLDEHPAFRFVRSRGRDPDRRVVMYETAG